MTVTLEGVTRAVDGIPTIRNVSLTLERGTLSVLLGPTLSGKTSIMRLLAGLDKPSSGRVLVDGKDVTGADVRQRSVAMVYQQFINYPSLTVYENIASPRATGGRSETFCPPIKMSPSVIASCPAIIRNVVVLPQPDGPNRQQYEARGIRKETLSTANVEP